MTESQRIMTCPKCLSSEKVKNGMIKGVQRYECKECGCAYTKSTKRGYPLSVKRNAIRHYLEGCGFRRIERLLGISNVTVLYWVRELGQKIKELALSAPTRTERIVELDELYTYVKKKRMTHGSGLELREIPRGYWPAMLGIVQA